MKTKQFHYSFIMFSLMFISCQNLTEENNKEYTTEKSSVVSILVSEKTDGKISFIAKASWHNGCGRFSHFISTKTDSTFYISVFGKQPKNAVCTQVFIEFDAPVVIALSGTGRYRFKFWQSDSTSVDTIIVF